MSATIINSHRRSMESFGGTIEATVITSGNHPYFPAVYVDHSRNWIEIDEIRFTEPPADVVAWLRGVADAIERATS